MKLKTVRSLLLTPCRSAPPIFHLFSERMCQVASTGIFCSLRVWIEGNGLLSLPVSFLLVFIQNSVWCQRYTELAGSYGWLAARCTDLSCLISFIKPKTTPYLYRAYNCISRQNTDELSILHNGQLVYISSCH